jgi:hypothetical protein
MKNTIATIQSITEIKFTRATTASPLLLLNLFLLRLYLVITSGI